jgi:hypothetical protein
VPEAAEVPEVAGAWAYANAAARQRTNVKRMNVFRIGRSFVTNRTEMILRTEPTADANEGC